MKLASAEKVHYDSGPNMTPLVDVVMVILIFLMLTGTFTGATYFLKSNLPITEKGTLPVANKEIYPHTDIDVRVDGNMDRARFTVVGSQPVDNAQALEQLLAAKKQQFLSSGTKESELQIIIGPGAGVPLQQVINAYQAAYKAKFEKIGFANSH